MNACNQRSNREPVMNLDEDDVRQALHGLENKGLAGRARSADGRVTKYEHWLGEAFNFSRAEEALVCVLLLRGPQTTGELRGRTERMHRFEEIADVLAGLQKLMEREPPLAAVLPRQPGTKEPRYAHLLSGPGGIDHACRGRTGSQRRRNHTGRAPRAVGSGRNRVAPGSGGAAAEVGQHRQGLGTLRGACHELHRAENRPPESYSARPRHTANHPRASAQLAAERNPASASSASAWPGRYL